MLPVFTTEQVIDGVDSTDLLIDLSSYMKKSEAKEEYYDKESIDSKLAAIEPDAGKIEKIDNDLTINGDVIVSKTLSAWRIDARSGGINANGPVNINSDVSIDGTLNGYTIGATNKGANYKNKKFIPAVVDDGVMEIGKYIDFHEYADANASEQDYKVRLESNNGRLITSGDVVVKGQLKIGGLEIKPDGDTYAACHVNGEQFWGCNSESDVMGVYKPLIITQDLRTESNMIVDNKLTVKNTDILAKITEIETILKNHYDALLVLCQKHGMIDSNTNDGSNITPN